jgi:hypothetical protein
LICSLDQKQFDRKYDSSQKFPKVVVFVGTAFPSPFETLSLLRSLSQYCLFVFGQESISIRQTKRYFYLATLFAFGVFFYQLNLLNANVIKVC